MAKMTVMSFLPRGLPLIAGILGSDLLDSIHYRAHQAMPSRIRLFLAAAYIGRIMACIDGKMTRTAQHAGDDNSIRACYVAAVTQRG